MTIHKLTSRKVATAGPGKYEDGGGLRVVVSATGAKKWVLRFTINGKRREMGLGSFPDVGLADARSKATEYRKQLKNGLDPHRGTADQTWEDAHIHHLCRPLHPRPSPGLEECQACPAVGPHSQGLRTARGSARKRWTPSPPKTFCKFSPPSGPPRPRPPSGYRVGSKTFSTTPPLTTTATP